MPSQTQTHTTLRSPRPAVGPAFSLYTPRRWKGSQILFEMGFCQCKTECGESRKITHRVHSAVVCLDHVKLLFICEKRKGPKMQMTKAGAHSKNRAGSSSCCACSQLGRCEVHINEATSQSQRLEQSQ